MSKKLYVGNLNYATREDALEDAFAQYGTVLSARIIFDRETQRSKGFGFIEMEDESAAEAAMSAMNGQELDGRSLRVNEAQERRPRRDY